MSTETTIEYKRLCVFAKETQDLVIDLRDTVSNARSRSMHDYQKANKFWIEFVSDYREAAAVCGLHPMAADLSLEEMVERLHYNRTDKTPRIILEALYVKRVARRLKE